MLKRQTVIVKIWNSTPHMSPGEAQDRARTDKERPEQTKNPGNVVQV